MCYHVQRNYLQLLTTRGVPNIFTFSVGPINLNKPAELRHCVRMRIYRPRKHFAQKDSSNPG
jgi:hypothetical protein